MPRALLVALLAALLLVPVSAEGKPGLRVRGTVTAKNSVAHLVAVEAPRQAVSLRVPGSLAAIRIGRRVELRGSVLRAHGRGSRVLARGVSIVSSQPLSATASQSPSDDDDDEGDDELEITGTLTALAPVTVASSARTASCTAPAGMSLAGFAVGDLVEMTCDLAGGTWIVRELEHEDDEDEDEDGDHSGPGSGDDDEDDDD